MLTVREVRLEAILRLRDAYRAEMNCQIVHDSWHARGFTRSYLFCRGDIVAGYGSVGGAPREPKTTVKELFLLPEHRGSTEDCFRRLVTISGAEKIQAQTNDHTLSRLLAKYGVEPIVETMLFADGAPTALQVPGTTLRRVTIVDRLRMFRHTSEPVGDWAIEDKGQIVATGGLLFHYNPPFGDIYMEVAAPFRHRGIGSYLVQQLRRICREGGHIPAARTGVDNLASQRTLERAGLVRCGSIVTARLQRAAAG